MAAKAPGADCDNCPLQSKPCAPTQFPKNGALSAAIVSRSPGYHEGIAGKPFSGPSGKVLDHLLKMNGVSRDEVILTNVVLCSPPEGKVPPEAIAACSGRLRKELDGVSLVVACGSEAVGALIGRGSINRYRGQRISDDRLSRTYVASNNPALVLRDDSSFPDLKRDFARAFNPLPPPRFPEVEVIENAKDARAYIEHLLGGSDRTIAADIESRGGISHKASLISMQFSTDGIRAVVLGEREGLWEDSDFVQGQLRSLLESPDHTFVWHGGKFDTKILRHTYGINARVDEDTMLLSYALDERGGVDERVGIHGLDYLLMDTFGWPHYSSPSIEKAKKTGIVENYEKFYRYAGLDVGGTFQLFEHQLPLSERDDVLRPYRHLLLRGTELAIGVELHGMEYDATAAADIYEFEVEPELRELTDKMRRAVDRPLLNPNSPIQVAKIFYDDYKAQHAMRKRPDKQRSVDDSARKEIIEGRFELESRYVQKYIPEPPTKVQLVERDDYKDRKKSLVHFVELYDRYQVLAKQASTYLLGMIKRAELDEASRIYTQLNFHTTNSGRLSSSKPNLQNITRTGRREDMPDIRRLFRASPGRQIVQADFSQAELRCIAQFSGDKELTRIYKENLSLHKETATRFYGENYTTEDYQTSKNVNFGVFYRQSAETFQEKHGIPKDKAQAYITWVWQTFTGVGEWEREIEKEIRTKGTLVSPFGRKRRFHLLTRENLQASFREGINFYPQSTASDITLCSGITLANETDKRRANICILVHDSTVADVEENYVDEYRTICQQVMESTAERELGWTLPFTVEIGVGPDWGSAK
jgi:uracil-DNA glycosylase family 4